MFNAGVSPSTVVTLLVGALMGSSVTMWTGGRAPSSAADLEVQAAAMDRFENIFVEMERQIAKMDSRMMALDAKLHNRLAKVSGPKMFQDIMDGMHSPQMNLTNTSDAYIVSFNLNSTNLTPGFKPEDVTLSIVGSQVILSGTRHTKTQYGETYASFSETVGGIPMDTAPSGAAASYDPKTQVLSIKLPKVAPKVVGTLKVPVQTGASWAQIRGGEH